MEGLYGLGAGIAQGLDKVTQGMMQAEEVRNNRTLMQQKAQMFNLQMQQGQQQMDQSALAIQQMSLQIGELQKQIAKSATWDALNGFEYSGDASILNTVKNNDMMKNILAQRGITGFNNVKDLSEEKKASLGITPEMLKDPTKRIVIANTADGNTVPWDMMQVYASTGFLPKLGEQKLADITLQANQLKVEKGQMEVDDIKKFFEKNPNATFADYEAQGQIKIANIKANLMKQAGSMDTSDIKEAKYFGALKSKVQNGTATVDEKAVYDAYLINKGGTSAIKLETIAKNTDALKTEGVNLDDPKFDINKLEGEQKAKAQKVIRELEGTEGGKKLVSNIAGILEKDQGAVTATADKLTSFAVDKNVKTDVVKEQINKVQAYLPTWMRDMSEEDLKDAQFRQAYLSTAAVFLKLQSGLTVSEAEATRFANSFGTLSKNEKVNMIGLKTKLDEVIGSYEANSLLEPTLYNAKYKQGVAKMKTISNKLDTYVGGKPAGGILTPEDTTSLDSIFGAK